MRTNNAIIYNNQSKDLIMMFTCARIMPLFTIIRVGLNYDVYMRTNNAIIYNNQSKDLIMMFTCARIMPLFTIIRVRT